MPTIKPRDPSVYRDHPIGAIGEPQEGDPINLVRLPEPEPGSPEAAIVNLRRATAESRPMESEWVDVPAGVKFSGGRTEPGDALPTDSPTPDEIWR